MLVKQMKKTILVILIILFLLPCVLADEQDLFKGWVYNGQSIKVDDQQYGISLYNSGEKLTIYHNNFDYYSVEFNHSEYRNGKRVVFEKSRYDTLKEEYKAYIKISKKLPEIEIQRNFERNNIYLGDEIEVEVIIKNLGDEDLDNVTFIDIYPEAINLTDSYGSSFIDENSVIWRGDIDDDIEFKYEIKALKKFKGMMRGKVSYIDEGSEKKEFSSNKNLEIKSFADIEMNLDKEDLMVGEENTLHLGITNELDEEIELKNLQISFPSTLDITESDFEKVTEHDYMLKNLEISPQRESKYIWDVKGKFSGANNIHFSATACREDDCYDIYETTSYRTTLEDIYIRTSYGKKETFESYQQENIRLYLSNSNQKINLTDSTIVVKSTRS